MVNLTAVFSCGVMPRYPEDRNSRLLWDARVYVPKYTALHPTIPWNSYNCLYFQTPASGFPGVEDDLVISGAGSGCNTDDEDECTPLYESGSGNYVHHILHDYNWGPTKKTLIILVCTVGQWQMYSSMVYPGIFFRGGFNKFSWGQRTDRMGIWGW
jgi:hypothetical protein